MSQLKFLVVDDASFIRDLLKKSLRDAYPGCEVVDVASAPKAQSALKTQRFDLILCDWEMPEMSGEEFLRWLREQEAGRDLPFIMVSSRGERDYVVKAVQAGANDYIGKPFKPETLRGKINKALRRAGISPQGSSGGGTTQGIAQASVDVLTGGGGAKSSPKAAAKPKTAARGQAQLKFPDFSLNCVIRDLSLQVLSGLVKREEHLPAVLEPVTVSISENDGEDVARLNGYVHGIQAAENRMDAGVLKITIRFVDEDANKLDQLSRFIGNF